MASERLAILGGEPAVTLLEPEQRQLEPHLTQAVLATVRESTRDWRALSSIAGGGLVGEFESRFAGYLGVRHALGLSSCTAALHTALIACGVSAEHEVIVSPYTWGQSVSPVCFLGARPVFADIDPVTYSLNPASVASRITPRTRALIVVHLFGHPAPMDELRAIADQHGLAIIEDCAQAAGATYKGRRVGTLGDVGCFSLGYGKALCGGEGGVLVTDDELLFERALLCTQHPLRQAREMRHLELRRLIGSLGYNYRMHPLAAAIAIAHLESLDSRNAARRDSFLMLSRQLTGVPGIRPVQVAAGCEHVFHRYVPSFAPEDLPGVSREAYVQALAAEGVPVSAGPVGVPIYHTSSFAHWHEVYANGLPGPQAARPRRCPVAERRCAQTELGLGSATAPPPWGDAFRQQLVTAFRKVARNASTFRRRGAPYASTGSRAR